MRGRAQPDIAREASNVAILRDQLAELDRDVAAGVIARDQYDAARRELEQRVIEESQVLRDKGAQPMRGGAKFAVALGAVVPVIAAALYFALGNPSALDPATQVATAPEHDVSGQQMNEMIAKLAARLEKEPDNATGWVMLARSYYAMGRMTEASRAFERAIALVPDDAELLADYADAAAATENTLDGKAKGLIERALEADPKQWKALALAGTAAFNRKDYATAVSYWERTKQSVPPTSSLAQSIDSSIAQARELGGLKASSSAAPAAPSDSKPTMKAAAPAPLPGASVAGEVKVSPSLAASVAPTDTVFVFARPAQGPKMPLAIFRLQAKDLPAKFNFDDSMAMTPDMKISNQAEVVIGARVSKSGQAMPQSGDLEGLSQPVKIGASGVAVVIDRTLP
jgi:cytochrome c-type biogenesis protein CcmH